MLILYYWCIIVQGRLLSYKKKSYFYLSLFTVSYNIITIHRRNICDKIFVLFFTTVWIVLLRQAPRFPSYYFAKGGQITRREKMQKIVKIPVGLPVAPGITENFSVFKSHTQFFSGPC